MSNPALDWVFAHSKSKGAARMVLVSLADQARKSNGNCWPSITCIMDRTKLTDRAVQSSLRWLEAHGELVTYRNAGPRGVNLYHLPLIHTGEQGSGANGVRGENNNANPRKKTRRRGKDVRPEPRENPIEPSAAKPKGHFSPGSGWIPEFVPEHHLTVVNG